MTPNFSVCLIARNEEKTLPRLLASLEEFKSLGGEVIIVDTGSTDKTVDVARAWGAKMMEVGDRFRITIDEETAEKINEHFIVEGEQDVVKAGDTLFDFSSARNFAASLACNDMIAMPDCDEVYTTLNLEKVCAAIQGGNQQLEYRFVYSRDEYGNPIYEFTHCKFYDRTKLKWSGIVHETLVGTANKLVVPEDVIKLDHYPNEETNRSGYLRGLALDCFLNPGNDRNSHYFARELLWNGRPRSAIKEFERHIAMNQWQQERGQSQIFIGDAYLALGEPENAIKAWEKAMTMDSSRRDPFLRIANYYWNKGDHQRTATYAMASLAINPKDLFYLDDMANYRHVPHEMLYWALWYLGDKVEAKKHFEKCLEYEPKNPKFIEENRFFA